MDQNNSQWLRLEVNYKNKNKNKFQSQSLNQTFFELFEIFFLNLRDMIES